MKCFWETVRGDGNKGGRQGKSGRKRMGCKEEGEHRETEQ